METSITLSGNLSPEIILGNLAIAHRIIIIPHHLTVGYAQNNCTIPDMRKNTPTIGLKFILFDARIICNIPAIAVAAAALKNSHLSLIYHNNCFSFQILFNESDNQL